MIDLLLVTPPSRKRVYQGLSDDFAAIEPPVWSGLIATYISSKNYQFWLANSKMQKMRFLKSPCYKPVLHHFCVQKT